MSKRKNDENKENELSVLKDSSAKKARRNLFDEGLQESPKESKSVILKRFNKLLKNPSPVVDFFIHGQANELPLMTGLSLENIGYISTPLAENQVQQISRIYFKNKEENTIDKAFLQIKNPLWHINLNKLVNKIANEMGVKDKIVHTKLEKLVVYKKGTKSNKSCEAILQDQSLEKFANLELNLPSDFSGTFHIYINKPSLNCFKKF
jgi:hypothetical protein